MAPISTGPLPGALTESSTWMLARNDFASCEANRAATPCVAKPMPLRTKSMPSEAAIALRSTSSAVNDELTSESRRVVARIFKPWSREAVV